MIDSHTHLLPDRLAKKIRAFFADKITSAFAYELDHREVLDRHLADGITTIWNLPYAHKAGIARGLNESMIEISKIDHPVTIIAGCTVHPDDDAPEAELRRAIAAGARVVKLHCSVGGFELDDPRLSAALDAAGELHAPIVYHAGHAISGSTVAADLAPLDRAARRHPKATFILAHFGHHALAEGMDLVSKVPNVYADLTPVVHDAVPVPAADLERLASKLLFGSDAPNTGISAGVLLAELRAKISDDAWSQITSANAARLARADSRP